MEERTKKEVHKFEFLVKASTWSDVVQIFKSELGIDKEKQNLSDRDIDGLFLVQVNLDEQHLTEEFYEKIKKSQLMAIVVDPKGTQIRNDLMKEAFVVETQLRKLLLHISDIAENYYDYFAKTRAKGFRENEDTISSDNLNPITSYLSFEDLIFILGSDLSSWDNKKLTAKDLLGLLESGKDIAGIKRDLRKKVKNNILWDQISNYVLETKVDWENIKEDLGKLKDLRNKAAHFRIVTEKDLIAARALARTLSKKTKKRSTISQKDIEKLRAATYPQFAEALLGTQYMARIAEEAQKTAAAALATIHPQVVASQSTIVNAVAASNEDGLKALRSLLGTPTPKLTDRSSEPGQ